MSLAAKLRKLTTDCRDCRFGFCCGKCFCCIPEVAVQAIVEKAQVGHHGGRDNRLNWTESGGEFSFNKYTVSSKEWKGTKQPWLVSYAGEPLLRNHGRCTGYRRFGSSEAAKKWVEKRLAERGTRP